MRKNIDNGLEKIYKIKDLAKDDRKFREKLLQNPIQVLYNFGIQVIDKKSLIIEYHDNYGLFIGFPKTADEIINIEEDSHKQKFVDLHPMDCTHY